MKKGKLPKNINKEAAEIQFWYLPHNHWKDPAQRILFYWYNEDAISRLEHPKGQPDITKNFGEGGADICKYYIGEIYWAARRRE